MTFTSVKTFHLIDQKKHKTRVSFLREELEKEEMYVEYLDKLLADIERHRKQEARLLTAAATTDADNNSADPTSGAYDSAMSAEMTSQTVAAVASMNDENKRRSQLLENVPMSLADELEFKRASLHLDIDAASKVGPPLTTNGNVKENSSSPTLSNPFVTVISVSSPTASGALKDRSDEKKQNQFQNLTFTKKKPTTEAAADVSGGSLKIKRAAKVPPPTQPRLRAGSRESLNSVSSPTTPTSPLISSTEDFGMSPREGLGVINSSISSSNESCKELDEEEEILAAKKSPRTGNELRLKKIAERSLTAPVMSTTGSLDKGFKQRGRPGTYHYYSIKSGIYSNKPDSFVSKMI